MDSGLRGLIIRTITPQSGHFGTVGGLRRDKRRRKRERPLTGGAGEGLDGADDGVRTRCGGGAGRAP
ncbi:hypothetical protein GCM10009639_09780 [Kitasatospora putterlickiae]|uniref:Uncharacterized protein n=1 Tax=Kitasatospora putterlickiae TaxID=221725 RepID=A0ABN1XNE7_9ACTN